MTDLAALAALAADPLPVLTARQIIERRLGRSLGPIETMPRDERDALRNLGLQLVKVKA
jgi:hypothetical protein